MMVHLIAGAFAALLVFSAIVLVIVDHFRTLAKRRHETEVRRNLKISLRADEDTKSLEREVDAKMEEMETLKGLSGIQSDMGHQVRAALAATNAGAPRRPSDSQISRDFHQKAEEVIRLSKRAAHG